jgi:hypothetical protein
MATPVQQNLVSSSEKYASSFTQGDLALPPAKKYLVGMMPSSLGPLVCNTLSQLNSDLHGRSH